jgi:hypothetical protein
MKFRFSRQNPPGHQTKPLLPVPKPSPFWLWRIVRIYSRRRTLTMKLVPCSVLPTSLPLYWRKISMFQLLPVHPIPGTPASWRYPFTPAIDLGATLLHDLSLGLFLSIFIFIIPPPFLELSFSASPLTKRPLFSLTALTPCQYTTIPLVHRTSSSHRCTLNSVPSLTLYYCTYISLISHSFYTCILLLDGFFVHR